MNIPQIQNCLIAGPKFGDVPLPTDTPWGNLWLKTMKIRFRIEHINIRLRNVFNVYPKCKSGAAKDHYICLSEIEEITYWLRKTVDEYIQLLFVCSHFKKHKKWPTEIEIDSVGTLLLSPRVDIYSFFNGHYAKLEQLNDISNAYKHGFMNSDNNYFGSENEPLVMSLHVERNNLKNPPKFIVISLRDVIAHFDQLNQHCRSKLLELMTSP